MSDLVVFLFGFGNGTVDRAYDDLLEEPSTDV